MIKMLFVMNPYAGTRRANRYLADILSLFNRSGYEVTIYMTGGPGDASRLVQEHAAKHDVVVCCGGDGTFNEAINGIMKSGCSIPLGYIPAGSTNDFAASLKLPSKIMEAAQLIVDGTPVSYDIGQFGSRYFSYVASFGAFTRVSYSTPQNIKNALGHAAYLLEGIQELSQIKPIHMRLQLENEVIEDEFLFGAISNSTSMGGILTLDPKKVDMRDGKFELLLVRAPRSLVEIPECIRAIQSQSYNCSMITFRSSPSVLATASQPLVWTLDGERSDSVETVEIVNHHRVIQLLQKGKTC